MPDVIFNIIRELTQKHGWRVTFDHHGPNLISVIVESRWPARTVEWHVDMDASEEEQVRRVANVLKHIERDFMNRKRMSDEDVWLAS